MSGIMKLQNAILHHGQNTHATGHVIVCINRLNNTVPTLSKPPEKK